MFYKAKILQAVISSALPLFHCSPHRIYPRCNNKYHFIQDLCFFHLRRGKEIFIWKYTFLVVWFLMCFKLFHISLRGQGGIQNRRQVRQLMINESYLMNISTSFVYMCVFPVAELIILGNNIESDT